MKLYVLTENNPCSPEFEAEHGLSLYIQTDDGTGILFDTGQTDLFIRNAEKLGIDLSDVDLAFLSHGHYDHGGGIPAFLAVNQKARVYLSDLAFTDCRHGERYIGIDPALKGNDRIIPVSDRVSLGENITFVTCKHQPLLQPVDSDGLTMETGHGEVPDRFDHEMYLILREKGRKVVFSGCSHRGILNIQDWLRPDIFVGGFHLMHVPVTGPDTPELNRIADRLLAYPTEYYTGHCTGTDQYDCLKARMGDRLHPLHAGLVCQLI